MAFGQCRKARQKVLERRGTLFYRGGALARSCRGEGDARCTAIAGPDRNPPERAMRP